MTEESNATHPNSGAAPRTLSTGERVWLTILASFATLAVATAIAVAITYFLRIDGAIATALTAGVIGAVILGILLFRWGTRVSVPDGSGRQPEGESTKNSLSALGVVAALTLLLLLGLALLLFFLSKQDTIQTAEVVLTPVILVAAVVLVLALGALTIVFKRLSLEDKKAAMGMPEGSIRAIIALLLIILFFVLSVYLFGQLRAGSGQGTLSGLTLAQVNSIPQDQIISRIPNGGTAEEPLYDVVRRIPPDSELHDIALQLLTTISTLVVAVAAFYFGSNSVTAAIAARRSGENGDEGKPDEGKTKPDETKPKPDETKPDEGTTKTDEAKPDEGTTKTDEAKPDEGTTKTDEPEPDEGKPAPDETKPDEGTTKTDETKPDEGTTKTDETKPDEGTTKTDETKPDEGTTKTDEGTTKTDETRTDETRTDETKPDETRTDD